MILISRILLKLKPTPVTVRTELITRRGFEHKLELWRWRSKHLPREEWKDGGGIICHRNWQRRGVYKNGVLIRNRTQFNLNVIFLLCNVDNITLLY